jgi:hypothetical protein
MFVMLPVINVVGQHLATYYELRQRQESGVVTRTQ